MAPIEPLPPDALYRRCDPNQFEFESTAELAPLNGVIGQERALSALRFGIGMRHENYHLFALGPPGVGKHAVLRRVLEERAAAESVPSDWCYVHNFAEPHRPKAISLPAGRGKDFRRAIEELIDELRSAIPAAFESEDFRIRRQAIEEAAKKRQEDAFNELREAAQARRIAVLRTPVGMMLAALRNDEVLPPEEFRRLPQAEQDRIKADIEELQGRLEAILQQVPQWEREVRGQLRQLGQDVTTSAVRRPDRRAPRRVPRPATGARASGCDGTRSDRDGQSVRRRAHGAVSGHRCRDGPGC
jgi:hypothetical protein